MRNPTRAPRLLLTLLLAACAVAWGADAQAQQITVPPVLIVNAVVYAPLDPIITWLGGTMDRDAATGVITVTLPDVVPANTPQKVNYVDTDGLHTVITIPPAATAVTVIEPAWLHATGDTLPAGPVTVPLAAPLLVRGGATYLPTTAYFTLFNIIPQWDLYSTGLILHHWRAPIDLLLPTDPNVTAPWFTPLT